MTGGDGYASPIIGGLGTLIRDNIRSRNYVPGTSGWAIFANGFAEFLNVVVRGTLQSSNYVAGTSGWKLDESGTAEIYDLIARGSIATGAAPDARVVLEDVTGPKISFFSGDPDEDTPGSISAGTFGLGGGPYLGLTSPALVDPPLGLGATTIVINGQDAGATGGGVFFITTNDPADPKAPASYSADFAVRLDNTEDLTLAGDQHAFQIGSDFGPNLAMDTNEVMARDFGEIATLALNADGGRVTAVDMRAQRSNDAGPRTTTSTSYATASSTASLSLNTGLPGGGSSTALTFLVSISADLDNSGATGLTWIGFEIRETNAAGSVLLSGNDGLAGMNEGTTRAISGRVVAVTVTTAVAVVLIRPMFKVSAGTGTYNDISLSAWQSL